MMAEIEQSRTGAKLEGGGVWGGRGTPPPPKKKKIRIIQIGRAIKYLAGQRSCIAVRMHVHWHRQFNYTRSLVMHCISAGTAGHHWFWNFWQGNSARHPPN